MIRSTNRKGSRLHSYMEHSARSSFLRQLDSSSSECHTTKGVILLAAPTATVIFTVTFKHNQVMFTINFTHTMLCTLSVMHPPPVFGM